MCFSISDGGVQHGVRQSLTSQSFSGSYPSPGTSLSLSPRAWSWLEKLTNSAPSSQSWGLFLRSFTMALRAARSSLLRSSSLFLLLRTGLGVCFLDMLATAVSAGQQHQNMSSYSNELVLASTTATHLEPIGKDRVGGGFQNRYITGYIVFLVSQHTKVVISVS